MTGAVFLITSIFIPLQPLQALLWESNDDSNEATRLVQKELDMYGGAGALLLIKADKRLQNLVLREALCHEPG